MAFPFFKCCLKSSFPFLFQYLISFSKTASFPTMISLAANTERPSILPFMVIFPPRQSISLETFPLSNSSPKAPFYFTIYISIHCNAAACCEQITDRNSFINKYLAAGNHRISRNVFTDVELSAGTANIIAYKSI